MVLPTKPGGRDREFLVDVSRLIWRSWRGRAATGIDRVCLAYVERFASRAQAVVQRRGFVFVLSLKHSDELFRLLLQRSAVTKSALARVLIPALARARRSPPRQRMTYLNVGHTGLDNAALPHWIAGHQVRPIYLIHDLIPLSHPQYCRAGESEKHARRIENALVSAHGLIGNSQATLTELEGFARSVGAKLRPSLAVWIGGQSNQVVAAKRLGRPYFVVVGTIEGRKNHLMLLQVWSRLVNALGQGAPVLVIIGGRGWEAEATIARLDNLGEFARHVQEIGTCGDAELAGWIAGARALLMPSFAEGFGLPIIEALNLGTPVIASDLPVFREIAGGMPTYLDPNDSAAWERVVRSFVTDCPERKRQLAQIPFYRAPTWENHFGIVESWLGTL